MTEEVNVQGKVIVTTSQGTKKEAEANVAGSQADPVVQNERDLPVRRFGEADYSKVGLTFGLTKSLGNFEFARIDVTIEDFCAVDKKVEALDQIKKLASEYVYKEAQAIDAYKAEKAAPKKEKLGI